MKLNIAVIEGGFSHEKIVSKKSALTVFENIDTVKYIPYRVVIEEEKWLVYWKGLEYPVDKNDFSFTTDGVKIKFDFAFIVIHGIPGEDGVLQAYFDLVNVPYSTSNHLVSALTFNKFICNQYLKNFSIHIPEAILVVETDPFVSETVEKKLGFPCFIKPVDGGSSFGVSKVNSKEEVVSAIVKAKKHGTQVVAEKAINGIEVTNGVYLSKKGVKVLPITEIVTANDFFDYHAKYEGGSEEITPARIDDSLTAKIKKTTLTIYNLLGLEGIARVDYIVENNIPYVIEINTVPGQSAESIIPKMAEVEGISLAELFNEVIEVTLSRF